MKFYTMRTTYDNCPAECRTILERKITEINSSTSEVEIVYNTSKNVKFNFNYFFSRKSCDEHCYNLKNDLSYYFKKLKPKTILQYAFALELYNNQRDTDIDFRPIRTNKSELWLEPIVENTYGYIVWRFQLELLALTLGMWPEDALLLVQQYNKGYQETSHSMLELKAGDTNLFEILDRRTITYGLSYPSLGDAKKIYDLLRKK